jgi:RHS repeat-associated protein
MSRPGLLPLVQEKQDYSGLGYMRNRYYDPATGRFTQEDPIGLAGGLNVYGLAEGNPVTYSNPYGLCPGIKGVLGKPTSPRKSVSKRAT